MPSDNIRHKSEFIGYIIQCTFENYFKPCLIDKFQTQQPTEQPIVDNDSIRALEEKVEERTNRQLRKTLFIRGIPEKEYKKWSNIDSTLFSLIAKTMSIPVQEAEKMIDRCHS